VSGFQFVLRQDRHLMIPDGRVQLVLSSRYASTLLACIAVVRLLSIISFKHPPLTIFSNTSPNTKSSGHAKKLTKSTKFKKRHPNPHQGALLQTPYPLSRTQAQIRPRSIPKKSTQQYHNVIKYPHILSLHSAKQLVSNPFVVMVFSALYLHYCISNNKSVTILYCMKKMKMEHFELFSTTYLKPAQRININKTNLQIK
jgi:hypothetical protein